MIRIIINAIYDRRRRISVFVPYVLLLRAKITDRLDPIGFDFDRKLEIENRLNRRDYNFTISQQFVLIALERKTLNDNNIYVFREYI